MVDHRDSVGKALFAVAGVGIAGVDDNRTGEAVLHVGLIAADTGRMDNVGRKDACRDGVDVRDDQREIVALALDAAVDACRFKALGSNDAAADDFHAAWDTVHIVLMS